MLRSLLLRRGLSFRLGAGLDAGAFPIAVREGPCVMVGFRSIWKFTNGGRTGDSPQQPFDYSLMAVRRARVHGVQFRPWTRWSGMLSYNAA